MDESHQNNDKESTEIFKQTTKAKEDTPQLKRKSRYFEGLGTGKGTKVHSKGQSKYGQEARKFHRSKKEWKFKTLQDKNKGSELTGKQHRKDKYFKGNTEEENSEKIENFREENDPFPGSKPIPKQTLEKYTRVKKMKSQARTKFQSKVLSKKMKKESLAAEQAARAELLQVEQGGFLEADEGESTTDITQHQLVRNVDISSAAKHFDLTLKDFGPYRIDYTRNGRFLLLGGGKGHIAAIDWMTKKLLCEINVMERINDVQWLHQETMFAVAQKNWTYVYDNQGIELHCLKNLHKVQRMEFLPYHFLLAAASSTGFLKFVDISIGEKVGEYNCLMGRLDVMCQNPSNAVIVLGHNPGVVTMWTPKVKEPIVKMLTHKAAVRSIAIDKSGMYMATSGMDRFLKIWDLRTYKLLQSYKLSAGPGTLSFSQSGLLATGTENLVEVYRDCCRNTVTSPYMVHRADSTIRNVQFCPFEDVLGLGLSSGFQSLIIPGAGEANFDAMELNPYQSKNHRRQAEVKMLLEKIPAELIHTDTNVIGKVVGISAEEEMDMAIKLKQGKVDKKTFEPKYKARGRSKGEKFIKRQKKMEENFKRDEIRQRIQDKQTQDRQKQMDEKRQSGVGNVLDRFKKKSI